MSEDSQLYTGALEYVRRCFSEEYNKSEDTLILSISRKGPKLLERVFRRENYAHYNTITEVALPFCMRRFADYKGELNIKIFDDAIYFGTTVEGICNELKNFARLYGVRTDKKLYTAIRATESKLNLQENLQDITIHSFRGGDEDSLRAGYGHYFIRRLAKDLESSNNTMEIEFPIVEFSCMDIIDRRNLFDIFRNVYGADHVYESGRTDNSNITIFLDDMPGRAFRKLRIYVDGTKLRVVCMSPWLMPNDVTVMLSLFRGTPWNVLWRDLTEACLGLIDGKRNFDVYALSKVERSIRKSLVIMANYILSFDLIRTEQSKLIKIFQLTEKKYFYDGVQIADLFYLLGDYDLCMKVKSLFKEAWSTFGLLAKEDIFSPNIKEQILKPDYQVFESSEFPEKEELLVFKQANGKMLSRCLDEQEALSALFFNQTSLIEKWSRRHEKYDFRRLRFGYTFQSLFSELKGRFPEKGSGQITRIIHQWVDHRVDQACIVPQYVVDHRTNTWCRVFRPGENEDALLNHLSRFVLNVFQIINKEVKMGWVNTKMFRELLALTLTDDNQEDLNETFDFRLRSDLAQRELYFVLEGEERSRNVFEYLVDMGILTDENSMVSISQDLTDEEMVHSTTLDKSLEDSIDQRMRTIVQQIVKNRYTRAPFFITNYYYFRNTDLPRMATLNTEIQGTLETVVNQLLAKNGHYNFTEEFVKGYYATRDFIVSIELLNNEELMMQMPFSNQERWEYIRQQIMLWRAKFTFDLIIAAFLQQDKRMITSELSDQPERYVSYGYYLWLNTETHDELNHIVDATDNMDEIRTAVLPVIEERVKIIKDVKLNAYERALQEETPKF